MLTEQPKILGSENVNRGPETPGLETGIYYSALKDTIISVCASVMHMGEDAYGDAYGRRWQCVDPVGCTVENKFEL